MSVPLARRNLWHEKGKLTLHILGIAAALALVILLIGFRDGMYASLTAYIDRIDVDLIIVQNGSRSLLTSDSSLPAEDHESIDALTNADATAHILVADVIFNHASHKTPVLLVGYNPLSGIGGPWNIGEGQTIQKDDEVMLDIWLAHRNDIAVGDRILILNREFTVVGLTRETSSWMSPYVFVSQQAAENVLGLPGTASFFLLRLPEDSDVSAISEQIEMTFPGTEALTPAQMAAADRNVLATVMDTPLRLIIFIGFVIGVAVMGLIVYASARDHMHEYGVLKAVGASGGWLLRRVVVETLYRTLVGFLIGVGLAYGSAALIMRLMPQFTVVIEIQTLVAAGIAGLLMTLLASVFPVRRVMAIDPNLVFNRG